MHLGLLITPHSSPNSLTLLSQHNCIVLALYCVICSLEKYKDSVYPLVKKGNTYSSKISSIQSSQVKSIINSANQDSLPIYQWHKPIRFYLSINKETEEFLSSFLVDNLFSSVLSSIRTIPSYLLSVQSLPIHIATLYPFHFPYLAISSAHTL